ncbi:hypothetical protein OCU04_001708 [Sclerotinia nivalis]|uniref:Uncharacterized protein n=1 Tax=Sclerotinia nivalis TaxID=352851 RepID=A0A9X0DQW2_9HELO|nr:hypothetical protein OCU04_001708 [Sclerotinia nivalis]
MSRRVNYNANGTASFVSNAPELLAQGFPGRFAGGMGNHHFQQQSQGMPGHPSQQQPQMRDHYAGNNMNNGGQQYQQMAGRYPAGMSNNYVQQQHTQAMSGHPAQQQPQTYDHHARNNMNNINQQYQRMGGGYAARMGNNHTQQQSQGMPGHPAQQQSQMRSYPRNNISDIGQQHQGGVANYHNHQHGGMVGRDAGGMNNNHVGRQPPGMTDRLSQQQNTTGNIAPTHAHGNPPVQQACDSNNLGPGRQHAMPPNTKDYVQPPSMRYSNTGRGTVTGPQNPTAALTTLGVQMPQSNNKQDVEKPLTRVNLNAQVREAPMTCPSAAQSSSLATSSTMTVPATTTSAVTTPAPPTAVPTQVPPPAMPTQVFPQAMPTQVPPPAMPTQVFPQAMPAAAPLPAAAGPAISKRVQNLQTENMKADKEKKKSNETRTGRRRRGQTTPDIQPVVEPTVDLTSRSIAKLTEQGYDITISNLAPAISSKNAQSIPKEDKELFDILGVELSNFQLNQDLVTGVMKELLEKSIAHLSLDTSSDTRQNLDYYEKTPDLGYHAGNLTQFAPKAQFVKTDVVVVRGKETSFTTVNEKAKMDPTCDIIYEPINGFFDGSSMMGNYTMYTRTIFVGPNIPLKYAVGFRIENVIIDGIHAQGMLTYERPLPTGIQGEPRWSDICDLLKLQHAEWNEKRRNQIQQAQRTSGPRQQMPRVQRTSPLSQQQTIPTQQTLSTQQETMPVQQQRVSTQQQAMPEQQQRLSTQQQTTQGEKRKFQQPATYPQLSTSTQRHGSSSSSEGQSSNSDAMSVDTNRTSVSPRVALSSEGSDNSRPNKRLRTEDDKSLPHSGSAVEERPSQHPVKERAYLPAGGTGSIDQRPQDNHNPSRNIANQVCMLQSALGPQNGMPSQPDFSDKEIARHRQSVINLLGPTRSFAVDQTSTKIGHNYSAEGEQTQMTDTHVQHQQPFRASGSIPAASGSIPDVKHQQPGQRLGPAAAASRSIPDVKHQRPGQSQANHPRMPNGQYQQSLYRPEHTAVRPTGVPNTQYQQFSRQPGPTVQESGNMSKTMIPPHQISPAQQFEQQNLVEFQQQIERLQQQQTLEQQIQLQQFQQNGPLQNPRLPGFLPGGFGSYPQPNTQLQNPQLSEFSLGGFGVYPQQNTQPQNPQFPNFPPASFGGYPFQ